MPLSQTLPSTACTTTDTTLLQLDDVCLQRVLDILPSADRRRLSRTCCFLRQFWRNSVQAAAISQDDLENYDDQPLCAFPNVKQLHLNSIGLDEDCSSCLQDCAALQQLQTLQVNNPQKLQPQALTSLLAVCSMLTSLQLTGDWQCGGGEVTVQLLSQRPAQLRQLQVLRNSSILPSELCTWLSAATAAAARTPPDASASSAVCGLDAGSREHSNSSSSSSHSVVGISNRDPPNNTGAAAAASAVQQRLLRLLADEAAAGDTAAAAAVDELALQQPAWPHLQELDLSGCSRLGGGWGFWSLLPQLQSLALHSCYKVTNDTLAAFARAVHNSTNSNDTGYASAQNLTPAASGAGSSSGNSVTHCHAQEAEEAAALQLRRLELSYTRVSDAGMTHLAAALPQLCWLGLKGCNVGDDGLVNLLQLQRLTALHIKHCHRVTDEGVQQLAALSQLRDFSYGYTSMPEADDVAAAIASQFKQLTALDLLASELTDTGLAALGGLQQLQQLKLYQAAVSADALQQLAGQPAGKGLRSLVLYGLGRLTQLRCLDAFLQLRTLQLGGLCHLANAPEAVQQLALLPQLQQLTLERINSLSLECLQHLMADSSSLLCLRVRGCDGVCEEDMQELANRAANCCKSSASVCWAASPSCDTDDEEDGWEVLPA